MQKTLFLLAFLTLSVATTPHASRAEGEVAGETGEPDTTLSREDLLTEAVTILLPDLEAKASRIDSVSDVRDLYRTVAVARGYLQLGLYEQADTWYERLSNLDGEGLFSEAVFHGRLSVAAGKGDLDRVHSLLSEQREGIAEPDGELLIRVLDQFADGGHWDRVETLIAGCQEQYFGEKPPAMILLLKGRSLRRQGRLAEAVFHFESLLNDLKVPSALHPSLLEQKDRIVQAAADCSFLLNDRMRARQLYRELLASKDPGYMAWGRFQLAQLDMLANEYEQAEEAFRIVSADTLGLRIGDWAGVLAEHCAAMKSYPQYHVITGPRSTAALQP